MEMRGEVALAKPNEKFSSSWPPLLQAGAGKAGSED